MGITYLFRGCQNLCFLCLDYFLMTKSLFGPGMADRSEYKITAYPLAILCNIYNI
jgi:hypothetical protein